MPVVSKGNFDVGSDYLDEYAQARDFALKAAQVRAQQQNAQAEIGLKQQQIQSTNSLERSRIGQQGAAQRGELDARNAALQQAGGQFQQTYALDQQKLAQQAQMNQQDWQYKQGIAANALAEQGRQHDLEAQGRSDRLRGEVLKERGSDIDRQLATATDPDTISSLVGQKQDMYHKYLNGGNLGDIASTPPASQPQPAPTDDSTAETTPQPQQTPANAGSDGGGADLDTSSMDGGDFTTQPTPEPAPEDWSTKETPALDQNSMPISQKQSMDDAPPIGTDPVSVATDPTPTQSDAMDKLDDAHENLKAADTPKAAASALETMKAATNDFESATGADMKQHISTLRATLAKTNRAILTTSGPEKARLQGLQAKVWTQLDGLTKMAQTAQIQQEKAYKGQYDGMAKQVEENLKQAQSLAKTDPSVAPLIGHYKQVLSAVNSARKTQPFGQFEDDLGKYTDGVAAKQLGGNPDDLLLAAQSKHDGQLNEQNYYDNVLSKPNRTKNEAGIKQQVKNDVANGKLNADAAQRILNATPTHSKIVQPILDEAAQQGDGPSQLAYLQLQKAILHPSPDGFLDNPDVAEQVATLAGLSKEDSISIRNMARSSKSISGGGSIGSGGWNLNGGVRGSQSNGTGTVSREKLDSVKKIWADQFKSRYAGHDMSDVDIAAARQQIDDAIQGLGKSRGHGNAAIKSQTVQPGTSTSIVSALAKGDTDGAKAQVDASSPDGGETVFDQYAKRQAAQRAGVHGGADAGDPLEKYKQIIADPNVSDTVKQGLGSKLKEASSLQSFALPGPSGPDGKPALNADGTPSPGAPPTAFQKKALNSASEAIMQGADSEIIKQGVKNLMDAHREDPAAGIEAAKLTPGDWHNWAMQFEDENGKSLMSPVQASKVYPGFEKDQAPRTQGEAAMEGLGLAGIAGLTMLGDTYAPEEGHLSDAAMRAEEEPPPAAGAPSAPKPRGPTPNAGPETPGQEAQRWQEWKDNLSQQERVNIAKAGIHPDDLNPLNRGGAAPSPQSPANSRNAQPVIKAEPLGKDPGTVEDFVKKNPEPTLEGDFKVRDEKTPETLKEQPSPGQKRSDEVADIVKKGGSDVSNFKDVPDLKEWVKTPEGQRWEANRAEIQAGKDRIEGGHAAWAKRNPDLAQAYEDLKNGQGRREAPADWPSGTTVAMERAPESAVSATPEDLMRPRTAGPDDLGNADAMKTPVPDAKKAPMDKAVESAAPQKYSPPKDEDSKGLRPWNEGYSGPKSDRGPITPSEAEMYLSAKDRALNAADRSMKPVQGREVENDARALPAPDEQPESSGDILPHMAEYVKEHFEDLPPAFREKPMEEQYNALKDLEGHLDLRGAVKGGTDSGIRNDPATKEALAQIVARRKAMAAQGWPRFGSSVKTFKR